MPFTGFIRVGQRSRSYWLDENIFFHIVPSKIKKSAVPQFVTCCGDVSTEHVLVITVSKIYFRDYSGIRQTSPSFYVSTVHVF